MVARPQKTDPNDLMKIYSVLLSRAQLAARLGQQYGGDRDVYEALGYDVDLTYDKFAARYERQDIAGAVINRPIAATWRGGFSLIESSNEEETELEKTWAQLYDQLALRTKFVRLDKLTGIGNYGVLLMGLDDVKTSEDFAKVVDARGKRELLYVKPLGEGSAEISTWEKDPSNPRYGLPLIYGITLTEPGGYSESTMQVHYTRVVHVAEGLLESEVEGQSRLRLVYNRLMDLEKIVGASAEMFWRGARPGYQGNVGPEYQLTDTIKDDLQDQIDEFEHNLRRILLLEGIDLKALQPQVADPVQHVDVQLQMISAATGIPKRILTGSERGELASTEDRNNWLELIQARREDFAEPLIIRPFVDRCIEYGILPPAHTEYSVEWSSLWEHSDKEKAEVGKIRAQALQAYTASPIAESIVPPEAFYEFFLGLTEDQIKLIQEIQQQAEKEEQEEMDRLSQE